MGFEWFKTDVIIICLFFFCDRVDTQFQIKLDRRFARI